MCSCARNPGVPGAPARRPPRAAQRARAGGRAAPPARPASCARRRPRRLPPPRQPHARRPLPAHARATLGHGSLHARAAQPAHAARMFRAPIEPPRKRVPAPSPPSTADRPDASAADAPPGGPPSPAAPPAICAASRSSSRRAASACAASARASASAARAAAASASPAGAREISLNMITLLCLLTNGLACLPRAPRLAAEQGTLPLPILLIRQPRCPANIQLCWHPLSCRRAAFTSAFPRPACPACCVHAAQFRGTCGPREAADAAQRSGGARRGAPHASAMRSLAVVSSCSSRRALPSSRASRLRADPDPNPGRAS